MSASDREPACAGVRPPGRRLAALCVIALIVLSGWLLRSMAAGARPIQSTGLVFGPARAVNPAGV